MNTREQAYIYSLENPGEDIYHSGGKKDNDSSRKKISQRELKELYHLEALIQERQHAFDAGEVEEEAYFDARLQNKINELE